MMSYDLESFRLMSENQQLSNHLVLIIHFLQRESKGLFKKLILDMEPWQIGIVLFHTLLKFFFWKEHFLSSLVTKPV